MRKNKAIAIILLIVVLLAGLGTYGMRVLHATTAKGDGSIILGLDLSGGVSITYQIVTSKLYI